MDNNNSVNSAEQRPKKPAFKFQISKLPAIPVAIVVIALLILPAYFYFFYTPLNPKVISSLQKASVQMSKGNYTQAQKEYTNALKISPNDPNAQSGMINSISAVGNQNGQENNQLKISQPYINQALNSNPNDLLVLMAVGYAYETAGNYNKALTYYQKATEVSPNLSDAWFHLGHVNQFLNNNSQAQKDNDRALQLEPNNTSALIVKANQLYSQNQPEQAFETYKKAAQYSYLNPQGKAEALSGASFIRRGQDNYAHLDESLSLAKQAVEIAPNFSPALAAYGNDLFLKGDTDQAIIYMKMAIAANPRISRNYADLGMIMRKKNDFTSSINDLNKAILSADNDNTLLMDTDRQKAKALYTYEVALSYSMSGIKADTVKLISDSIAMNPNIKLLAKYDYEKRGFFKELSANSEFLNLIKS